MATIHSPQLDKVLFWKLKFHEVTPVYNHARAFCYSRSKDQHLMCHVVFMAYVLPSTPTSSLTPLPVVQCSPIFSNIYQIFSPFCLIWFLEASNCHPIPLLDPQLTAILPWCHIPNIISLENSSGFSLILVPTARSHTTVYFSLPNHLLTSDFTNLSR